MKKNEGIWNIAIICLIALFSLSIAGCTSTVGQRIKKSDVLEIHKDVTTKDEILEKFGAPDHIQYSPLGEEIFIYKYVESKEVHVGGVVGITARRVIPGFAATTIGSKKQEVKTDTLMIFMDSKGIVRHYGFRKET